VHSDFGLDVRAVTGAILHAVAVWVAAVAVSVIPLLALALVLELRVIHLVRPDVVEVVGGRVDVELDHCYVMC
jgi:hypothetical protein